MTFDEYINNPMGANNAVISNRNMYRNMYMEKWDRIFMREDGKIDYKLYTTDSDYYALIKIPSEVVNNFYYDVVIHFYQGKTASPSDRVLNNYQVEFFSNDPAFVFNFAHAFIKNKMFFSDLEPKMSKIAVKEKGKIKNPKDEIGYVKSLYFAYLFMIKAGLFNKIKYDTAKKYTKKDILSIVEKADIKIDKRQEEASKLVKKKNKEKQREIIDNNRSNINKSTKVIKNTNIINSAKKIGTSKLTKKVKRK